jgi:translocation and assembly module TamB
VPAEQFQRPDQDLLDGAARVQRQVRILEDVLDAAALLGGPGGGMTEELSRSLGLDSFSIGQGELNSTTRARSSRVLGSGQTVSGGPSVSGQVLSLGKRLGPDLFLNFEQSLGGAATLVKLTYQISRRLSVIARGGTDTALDVQYGFSFR